MYRAMLCKVIVEPYLVEPVRLLTSVVCAVLPKSIGNLRNLTMLNVEGNALQGKCRVVPSRTSATSGLSPVSVCVFGAARVHLQLACRAMRDNEGYILSNHRMTSRDRGPVIQRSQIDPASTFLLDLIHRSANV
jgi:hypothetical protein